MIQNQLPKNVDYNNKTEKVLQIFSKNPKRNAICRILVKEVKSGTEYFRRRKELKCT